MTFQFSNTCFYTWVIISLDETLRTWFSLKKKKKWTCWQSSSWLTLDPDHVLFATLGEKSGSGLCFKSTPCSKSSQEGHEDLEKEALMWEESGYDRGVLCTDTGDGVGGTWQGGRSEVFPLPQPQGGWLSDTWGTQRVKQHPELKRGLTAEEQSRPKRDGLWTEGKQGLILTEKRQPPGCQETLTSCQEFPR